MKFVAARVVDWESQVVIEAIEYRNQPLGAALVRYAIDIHHACAAIRMVMARYGELRDSDLSDAAAVREVIEDLSATWRRHSDWRETWPAWTQPGDSGDSS